MSSLVSPLLTGGRLRALLLSAAGAAAGYLVFSLWGGWAGVTHAIAQVGWQGAVVMLALSLLNYALRFVRWQHYLAALGTCVPWQRSALIYLSGFALTTTPGKAGEALRSVFLLPLGMRYSASIAAFLSERVSDLVAVILLVCLGIAGHTQAWPLLAAGAAAATCLLTLLSRPSVLTAWCERRIAANQKGRLERLATGLISTLQEARACHRFGVLVSATLLSTVAWSAEALAFYWLLGWMGLEVPWTFAFFVYALSMLAGALSFLPGGLGGAEATMVGLLLWAGHPQSSAVAATVLIRLTTLWFAVALGLLALGALTRLQPQAIATPGAKA